MTKNQKMMMPQRKMKIHSDSDSKDTTPEIPLPEVETVNDDGE